MLAACGVKQVSKRQAREKVPRGCYCRLFASFECWRRRRPLRCRRRRGSTPRRVLPCILAAISLNSSSSSGGRNCATTTRSEQQARALPVDCMSLCCSPTLASILSMLCFFPCRFSSSCDCQSATQIVVIVADLTCCLLSFFEAEACRCSATILLRSMSC